MRLTMLFPATGSISMNCALVRAGVRRRRWPLPSLVRRNIPEPVRRKRLDVALCVLILGTCTYLFRTRLFLGRGRQHHEHRTAFHVRPLLDHAHIRQLVCHAGQFLAGNVRVSDLTTPEVDTHLDFHAQIQPAARIAHFETAMMIVRLGAQSDLFDFNDLLRLFGLALLFRQLVQKLAIVHDLAHGGLGRGRDLDEVKFVFASDAESFLNGYYTDVLTLGADQPDFTDSDAFVDTMVFGANTLLPLTINAPEFAPGRSERNHNTKDANRQLDEGRSFLLNGRRNVMMQSSVLTEVSVPPLIFHTRRAELHVRPATSNDLDELRRLVEESRHAHVQLDWWTWDDWVGNPGFLVADESGRIVGMGLSVRDASPVAWLRAVVAEDGLGVGALLDALLPQMTATVRAQGVKALACLAWPEWLSDKLPERGFEPLAQVITLRKDDMTTPTVRLPPVLIREASLADLDSVVAIDHAAFETAWWYGETTFFRALRGAMRFCVADRAGQPIGYAFAHINGTQAHVTRLAVHPSHQLQGIGTLMLADLIEHTRAQGAEFITLNTQTHNENSQKLYRRFGFEPVGQAATAWIRSIEPQG